MSDSGPSPIGRRAFIAGTAGALTAVALQRSVAHAVEPGASFFETHSPRRLCDTRGTGYGYTRVDASTIRVRIGGNGDIPADAVAAVFTLTCTNNSARGNYATAFPSGRSRPNASNVNLAGGENTVANLVTVKLGTGSHPGYVDIYTFSPCDVLVDIAGVYRPTSSSVAAGRLVTVDPMARVADTRGGPKPRAGSIIQVNLTSYLPADAVAVVANITAAEVEEWGFLTAYERDRPAPPNASNLNVVAGDVRAVGTVTRLGTSGGIRGINIYTYGRCHIIVDIAGFITGPSGSDGKGSSGPSTDGLFVPIEPVRMLDTRANSQRLWPGWTKPFTLPAAFATKARAVAMNLTADRAMGPGYFTVHPAQRTRYNVSNLNVSRAGQTVANHVISAVSTSGVATWSDRGSHLIADLSGWFTGGAAAIQGPPPANPHPPARLPWTLQVDRMNLRREVHGGKAIPVVDAGNAWHWTGTGLVGDGEHTAVFGHRTDAGGPFRQQHALVAGDKLYVWTNDNRVYEFEYVTRRLTSEFNEDVLEATRVIGGPTFALVACSRTDWLPTSLRHRIVSVFKFIKWTDLG